MMYFSVQDYRTSAIRMRSIMTGDRDLRLVYTELLYALWEHGGYVPADAEQLVDILGLPLEVIEKALPVIEDFGRRSTRGGCKITNGQISNQRILEDLAREIEYREKQAEFGHRGGVAKAKASRRVAQGSAKGSVSPSSASTPASTPTSKETDTSCLQGPTLEELAEAPVKTPQQLFVDAGWELYDRFGARRPAAGLLGAWAKEFCAGDRGWLLRELEDLGLSGHLSKGDGYVRQALAGLAQRKHPVGVEVAPPRPALVVGSRSLDGSMVWNGKDWDPAEAPAGDANVLLPPWPVRA